MTSLANRQKDKRGLITVRGKERKVKGTKITEERKREREQGMKEIGGVIERRGNVNRKKKRNTAEKQVDGEAETQNT